MHKTKRQRRSERYVSDMIDALTDEVFSYDVSILNEDAKELIDDFYSWGIINFTSNSKIMTANEDPPLPDQLILEEVDDITSHVEEEDTVLPLPHERSSLSYMERAHSRTSSALTSPRNTISNILFGSRPVTPEEEELVMSNTAESEYFSSLRFASIAAPNKMIPWKLTRSIKEYEPPPNMRTEDLIAMHITRNIADYSQTLSQ
ncbi:hypothetical protein PCE1_002259 [Barthelona sp. PCE]